MWIARNEGGELVMLEKKPFRCTLNGRGIWMTNLEKPFLIHKSLFPELKWEDEPVEVDIVKHDEIKQLQQVNKLLKNCNIEKSVLAQEYRRGYDDGMRQAKKNANAIKAFCSIRCAEDADNCKRECPFKQAFIEELKNE